ncbi:MAG TPA: hypothetical protein DCZ92_08790 [Elusimicrobia bacterium]|nr:MAG: hypothetical protein A2016_01730 [Elusimicrobia bacterium GWF2_62_30]HBA60902.1 hypothetical protein [Elusimicrobiota bacterium]
MKQVTAAVMEKDGKLLLAQRRQGDALAGKWEFPGGKIEPGETPEACLRRELKEEFGIDTKIGAFICASRFEYKHLPIELLAYRVTHLSGEFKLNDHDRIEWVAPGDLLKYDLSSADIPVAQALLPSPLPFKTDEKFGAAMPPGMLAELAAREKAVAGNDPVCPDCKAPMVLRISQRGPVPGAKFWGCPNYPKCRATIEFKK